jgi:hypothetical protein
VLFDPTELEGIRQRMVQYDEKRENLIKASHSKSTNRPHLQIGLKETLCPPSHRTPLIYLYGASVWVQVCRDVQKSSKNAIYSVHRGDLDKAKKLLEAARYTPQEYPV